MNMNIKYQRPIVELKSWHNFEALLDTGAFFPVWTVDETILEMLGGTFLRKDITFSGFGGRTKGNLYKLQSLSATMFQNLIYEIDDKNHRFNVTIPDDESNVRNLRIEDANGRLHILCHSA